MTHMRLILEIGLAKILRLLVELKLITRNALIANVVLKAALYSMVDLLPNKTMETTVATFIVSLAIEPA